MFSFEILKLNTKEPSQKPPKTSGKLTRFTNLCQLVIELFHFLLKMKYKIISYQNTGLTLDQENNLPLNQFREAIAHLVKSIIFQPIRFEHGTYRPYCLNLPFNLREEIAHLVSVGVDCSHGP